MLVIKLQQDGTYVNADTGAAVTRHELSELVRGGEAFQILEPAHEKDVTAQVLAEIFFKEGLTTKQAFFKRYVIDGLSKESNRVETLARKLLHAGIGVAEEAITRFEALAAKGEASQRGFAKALRDGLNQLEAAPGELRAKVDRLLQQDDGGNVTDLKAKVEALTETVGQLNGHKPAAGEKHAKKPASV